MKIALFTHHPIKLKMHNCLSLTLLFVPLASILSCHNLEKADNDHTAKVLPYSERYTYLTDTAETKWLAEPFAKFWQPTDSQKKIMENLAIEQIAAHREPKHMKLRNEPFERYYRQYIAYVSLEGDSLLNINADCLLWGYDNPNWELDSLYFDRLIMWRNQSIVGDDGGDCFWGMEVNYSKHSVTEFYVNNSL